MSVSRMPLRRPERAKDRAKFTAIVDLPTPPLAEETAMTFFTSLMLRCCGRPRCMRGICGGAPERGRPLNGQLDFVNGVFTIPVDSHGLEGVAE